MRAVCAWCRREGLPGDLGEREPLDDPTETHGICARHVERVRAQLSPAGVRVLLVVAANQPSLHRHLERSFATIRDVRVLLDRRQCDRRRGRGGMAADERRRSERRRVSEMCPLGYQMVRLGVP